MVCGEHHHGPETDRRRSIAPTAFFFFPLSLPQISARRQFFGRAAAVVATGALLRAAPAQAFEKAEVDAKLLKKMCANNPTSKACLDNYTAASDVAAKK